MFKLTLNKNFIQSFIKGTLFGISFLFFSCHPVFAKSKPSWYPKISCSEAWENKNPYLYDFKKYSAKKQNEQGNFGYQNFIDDVESKTSTPRKHCYKQWTIMVYMAANNDLSPYSLWDLTEMESAYILQRAGSTETLDLLVDVQNEKSQDLRRLHIFQSENEFNRNLTLKDAKLMDFDSIQSPIAHWNKQRETTPEEQLNSFIKWSVTNYPAENYMLVVWGHGQGWGANGESLSQMGTFAGRFGGLAFQNKDSEFLTTPALARVLEIAKNDVFEGKDSIDLYASDACLMQMMEVAYELSPHTRYITGSAQIQSYLGFPYRRMIYEINRGCYNEREKGSLYCGDNIGLQQTRPDTETLPRLEQICGQDKACYLAQMLPKLSWQSFHNHLGLQGKASPDSYNNMTMSSFNAQSLHQSLSSMIDDLAKNMIPFLNSMSIEESNEFRELIVSSHSFLGSGRELGILLGQMELYALNIDSKESEKFYNSVVEFKTWLNALVLDQAFGKNYIDDGFYLLGAKSVALWIPPTKELFEARLEDFQQSKLYQDLKKDPQTGISYWQTAIELLLTPKKMSL